MFTYYGTFWFPADFPLVSGEEERRSQADESGREELRRTTDVRVAQPGKEEEEEEEEEEDDDDDNDDDEAEAIWRTGP